MKVAAVFTKTTFARTEIIVNVNLNFLLNHEMMLFVVELVLCRMDVETILLGESNTHLGFEHQHSSMKIVSDWPSPFLIIEFQTKQLP